MVLLGGWRSKKSKNPIGVEDCGEIKSKIDPTRSGDDCVLAAKTLRGYVRRAGRWSYKII